uniref:Btz domain-containing protein n=1 Tax=Caenorhabditis tropicalis TaxID=1561998 RepID=A0A1I7U2B3_9PELO
MHEECQMNAAKQNDRVGRRNDRKRDAQQANLPERSPSLRAEPRHQQQRCHPYLPPRNNAHRQRPMIRPSSVVSMSGRSIAPSDSSDNDYTFDVDEEMEGMSLDSPLPQEQEPPTLIGKQPGWLRQRPGQRLGWSDEFSRLEWQAGSSEMAKSVRRVSDRDSDWDSEQDLGTRMVSVLIDVLKVAGILH